LFYNVNLLSEETFNKILEKKPKDWNCEFCDYVYDEIEKNKNKYKVYPVYYPVCNGIFNIDKSIEDIKWTIDNEIK
jgi:rubredoxin